MSSHRAAMSISSSLRKQEEGGQAETTWATFNRSSLPRVMIIHRDPNRCTHLSE